MRGDIPVFRQRLLQWFTQHSRNLPWRNNPTLYKTVVSEFMLQQTQVDTVIPYFHRWMDAFPGFDRLAEAAEQEVLKLWEGLGYYSRARNLHKLSRSIVEEGAPTTFEDWLRRPGIGPYTAAAISSISQGLPEPVIDGNVIRVLSRVFHDTRPIASSADGRKRFLSKARDLIDPNRPGDFNESIMELGATVCRKVRPNCQCCPVSDHCRAVLEGRPEDLPVIRRKPSTSRQVARLWLLRDAALLLHFYPEDAPRLAGFAELPELDAYPSSKPLLVQSRGIGTERIRESIFALSMQHPSSGKSIRSKTTRWVPLSSLSSVPLSGPHKRWILRLLQEPSAGAVE